MKRTSVAQLASEAGIEMDEALIALWDAGFHKLTGPRDLLSRGDANRARRALGLATRRELASPEYWQSQLSLSRPELDSLLADLGVSRPFDGTRLRARAIHRLRSERRLRALPIPAEEPVVLTAQAETEQPLIWEIIGHELTLSYLSLEDAIAIHEELVADFANTSDPLEPPGVRSIALLDSAVHRPRTSNGEVFKYPTVEMAAAALLYGLVQDHPFHNGNKRTGLVALLVFLDENGMLLTCEEDALFKLVLQLAQHALVKGVRRELADREVLEVARWIRRNSRLMGKGDRALPWRRLRRILADYDCVLSFPGSGNRINIERRVIGKSRWLGRPREIILKTQTHYGDEGREVDKTAINRIRRELYLDDDHGVDSATFYDRAATTPSEFILRYRKTLRRLARL